MYYVVYDGCCNLCTTLVQRLEHIDQGRTFQYVPMQDEARLYTWGISPDQCEQGMILLQADDPGQRWQGSAAAEEIGRLLPAVQPLVDIYRQLPGLKWMGDRAYEVIRDHRYTLFGRRAQVYQPAYPICDRTTPCNPFPSSMRIRFADQDLVITAPSLFLAGPTPRESTVTSWRLDALKLLEQLNFRGTVLVPERQDWQTRFDYQDQVEWEYAALEQASVIVFWIPRDLVHLPGFTTNVEFGRYVGTKRCVYGRPPNAPKTQYLDWLYEKLQGQAPCESLDQTLKQALTCL